MDVKETRLVIMSAKSISGPGGKKPASAATNLIGELDFEYHIVDLTDEDQLAVVLG